MCACGKATCPSCNPPAESFLPENGAGLSPEEKFVTSVSTDFPGVNSDELYTKMKEILKKMDKKPLLKNAMTTKGFAKGGPTFHQTPMVDAAGNPMFGPYGAKFVAYKNTGDKAGMIELIESLPPKFYATDSKTEDSGYVKSHVDHGKDQFSVNCSLCRVMFRRFAARHDHSSYGEASKALNLYYSIGDIYISAEQGVFGYHSQSKPYLPQTSFTGANYAVVYPKLAVAHAMEGCGVCQEEIDDLFAKEKPTVTYNKMSPKPVKQTPSETKPLGEALTEPDFKSLGEVFSKSKLESHEEHYDAFDSNCPVCIKAFLEWITWHGASETFLTFDDAAKAWHKWDEEFSNPYPPNENIGVGITPLNFDVGLLFSEVVVEHMEDGCAYCFDKVTDHLKSMSKKVQPLNLAAVSAISLEQHMKFHKEVPDFENCTACWDWFRWFHHEHEVTDQFGLATANNLSYLFDKELKSPFEDSILVHHPKQNHTYLPMFPEAVIKHAKKGCSSCVSLLGDYYDGIGIGGHIYEGGKNNKPYGKFIDFSGTDYGTYPVVSGNSFTISPGSLTFTSDASNFNVFYGGEVPKAQPAAKQQIIPGKPNLVKVKIMRADGQVQEINAFVHVTDSGLVEIEEVPSPTAPDSGLMTMNPHSSMVIRTKDKGAMIHVPDNCEYIRVP